MKAHPIEAFRHGFGVARSLSMIRTCAGVAGAASGVAAGVWEREVETVISLMIADRADCDQNPATWWVSYVGTPKRFEGDTRPKPPARHARAAGPSLALCAWYCYFLP